MTAALALRAWSWRAWREWLAVLDIFARIEKLTACVDFVVGDRARRVNLR
jgi:hypothetical protein